MNLVRLPAPFLSFLLVAILASPLYCAADSADRDNPQIRTDAELHLMTGELAAGRNQPGIAARELLKALEVLDDKDLARRATTYALAARDSDLALLAAQRWQQLDPKATDAREVITRLSVSKGKADEAFAQAVEIVKGTASGEGDGLMQVARMLAQTEPEQADTAFAVMNRLLTLWPKSAAGQHGLSLIALRYNKLDLAETAANEAIRLDPENREHALLRVGVLVRQKRLDEADSDLEKLLKDEKNTPEVRMGYVKLLLEANQREHAKQQLQTILKDNSDYADALYALGILSFNDKDYDAAESQFKTLLSGDRSQEAAYQLGRIAEAKDDSENALGYYNRVIKGNLVVDAAVRKAYVLAKLKLFDEAQQLMAQLREQLPQLEQHLYLAEADLLFQNKEYDRATAVYAAGLESLPGDEELLYGRSILHERKGAIVLAEQDLRKMIAENANDSRALNALGYMLTVHTKRFQEAKKLISRALELEPEDAAIMDSMGWVQFKLGKKADALASLKKAYERFPDPEVAAHLGEVLWTAGDQDQARSIWLKAQKVTPDNEALNRVIKRFVK